MKRMTQFVNNRSKFKVIKNKKLICMYLKERHVTRPYFVSIYNLKKLINVLSPMSHLLQRLLLPQILIKVGGFY
jgi:hypothetical protein